MDKPSYLRRLLDFKFDSLSVANQLCEDRYARVMHSGFGWLGERSLYLQTLLLVYQQQAFHTEAYTRSVIHGQCGGF
jgi:hypothetical protein